MMRILLIVNLLILSACGSAPEFPEELTPAPQYAAQPRIEYFSLVFPDHRQPLLSLQLAMVDYKRQGAKIERTLLQHHIAYQWLRVATAEGPRWLLVTMPFANEQQMIRHRERLQRLLPVLEDMPALAVVAAEELTQSVAQRQEKPVAINHEKGG